MSHSLLLGHASKKLVQSTSAYIQEPWWLAGYELGGHGGGTGPG